MGSDEVEKDAGGNLKEPGLPTIVTCVGEAWNSLPDSMVYRSFLKTGISNRMDGREDDMLRKESGCPSSESDDKNVFEITDTTDCDTDEKFTIALAAIWCV